VELEDLLLFDTSPYPELHKSNLCLKNQYNIIFPTVSLPLKLFIFFIRPQENLRKIYFRHVWNIILDSLFILSTIYLIKKSKIANSEDPNLRGSLGACYILPIRSIVFPHHSVLENLQSVVFLQREKSMKFAIWKKGNFIIYSDSWSWDLHCPV
jgi:hypothetical protein